MFTGYFWTVVWGVVVAVWSCCCVGKGATRYGLVSVLLRLPVGRLVVALLG